MFLLISAKRSLVTRDVIYIPNNADNSTNNALTPKFKVDAFATLLFNLLGFTPSPGSPNKALHTLHNDSLNVVLKLLE